ncbi:MAG: hypothetical protein JRJ31_18945 [Deltaproteobacteria bacterium]|nr:hypothetical protein [Deltaproteobacteria bacterium]
MNARHAFIKPTLVLILFLSIVCFVTKPVISQASEYKQITISLGVDIPTLDPYGHSDAASFSIWKHMLEPLVLFNFYERRFYGALAESWTVEGKEWTFKLRKGVKFHNGADFTAKDVKFSFERIKRIGKQVILGDLEGIKIVDNYTVKLITKRPFPPFLSRLWDAVIVSEQVYKKYGEDATKHPIGTGPFKFVEWVRGSHLVAEKNYNYWGEPAKIDRVIWKPIGETAARITALEKGSTDIAVDIPPHEVARLEKNPNIRIEKVRSMRLIQVALSPRFKPFQNRLVRLAVNYAVDVDSLIKYVLQGRGYRAASLSGPASIGYDPGLKPFPYDSAKAKALLAQAGYPNGFEVDFYAPNGRYPKDRELAQAIAGQLAKVGIRARVITPEWSIFWSSVRKGKYSMFYFGGFNHVDPDIFLKLYFRTGFSPRIGYSNPEVDKLIDTQGSEFDQEKRNKLVQRVIRMIIEDVPTILLYHHEKLFGVRENVVWKPTPEETVNVQQASMR